MTDGHDPALATEIGRAVRQHRTARAQSMRALAAEAGVSQPYLSKLENGLLLPSMSGLYAVAAALDIPPTELMPRVSGSVTNEAPVHFPIAAGSSSKQGPLGSMELLSGGPGRHLEAYRLIVRPGYRDDAEYRHDGEEFVYVIRGPVVLSRTDQPDVTLQAGDSITVDPTVGHRWSMPADASGEAEYLLTCTAR